MPDFFGKFHRQLLVIYREPVTEWMKGDQLRTRLEGLRNAMLAQSCGGSLLAYERYLALIARRAGDPTLVTTLSCLDIDRFETRLQRDPSQPHTLLGLALAHLRHGDRSRGRHLLRRLAASGLPERADAQRILGRLSTGVDRV